MFLNSRYADRQRSEENFYRPEKLFLRKVFPLLNLLGKGCSKDYEIVTKKQQNSHAGYLQLLQFISLLSSSIEKQDYELSLSVHPIAFRTN